jgi:hypothetical protein
MEALEELPPKAKAAYLQYLPQFQLDADYFVFDLLPLLKTPGQWSLIYSLTASTSIGSAASVSKLDQDFIIPMKSIALTFPPDVGTEDMQDAIQDFQGAIFKLAKGARKGTTEGNVAPPSAQEMKEVEGSWEAARVALNKFFNIVNEATSSKRLVQIPPASAAGAGYPRSKQLYTNLKKDAALCRQRGGQTLAGLWGQLMVYGTVPGVNPCGNAAEKYFAQGV